MHTYRFGKKIKLPSTIAIKHQIRKLMWEDLVKETDHQSLISPPPAGVPNTLAAGTFGY